MAQGSAAVKGRRRERPAPAGGAEPLLLTAAMAPKPQRRPPRIRRRRRAAGPWALIVLMFVGLLLAGAVMGLSGKPVRLPLWVVVEAETRLNAVLAEAVAGGATGRDVASVSIGGAVAVVDPDWTPRLVLEDLRLTQAGGETLLVLPEAWFTFDPGALAGAELRLQSLRLVGAHIGLRRLANGQFDLSLGGASPTLSFDSLAALLDAADAAFALPALSRLTHVEAEALTLSVEDLAAGRTWDMGDGRLRLEAREEGLAAAVGLSLIGGGTAAARAEVTVTTDRQGPGARLGVAVEQVAAADLAALAAPLAWLGVLDAPISGRIDAGLDEAGRIGPLTAQLNIARGALTPGPGAAPVDFDHAAVGFSFDPERERLSLHEIAVESPSLKVRARGHADLPGAASGQVSEMVAQIAFAEVRIDPQGVFMLPVSFDGGALDLRLRLSPFAVDIGQMVLLDGERRLALTGRAAAEDQGWRLSMDAALNAVSHERLVALWPLALAPRTRDWLSTNLQQGELFNVRAAVRLVPGAEPRLQLTYDYTGAGVRFMPTLPPILGGSGYATLDGTRYTVVVDRGRVLAPDGGEIEVQGSVFTVPDIRERPARAEIDLNTSGSLTATLSLLDQPPFGFLTKAGRPVDLGQGQARMRAHVAMPLVRGVPIAEIDWRVEGTIEALDSEVLIPGRRLQADRLTLAGVPAALDIAGQGTLDGVPFQAAYRLPLGPEAPPARVSGSIEVSAEAVRRLALGLPPGLVGGQGEADFTAVLPKGEAPQLTLSSDLRGVSLSIPEIGWSKARAPAGRLEVAARLGQPASVERLELEAAGLQAVGSVSLRPGGGLDRARFSRVRTGWFEGAAVLVGRGGATPNVQIEGGQVDLRRLPEGLGRGGGGGGGSEITARLDRLRVTEAIALTGLSGSFSTRGGFGGRFQARVNGGAPVQGTVAPEAAGTAVRILSQDAGGVLASAGLFPNARGGELSLVLRPRAGGHDGRAEMKNVRMRDAPVLAELLNAASIIGLLEQLNGSGLLFLEAETDFRLTSRGVEIARGAAVGASMGVSMAGIYDADRGVLDLQGVISPFYLVNGIGAILTRRGEGLFGVNYRVTGPTSNPTVSVNPLSILTPGMFREIFRRPPPRIRETG